MTVPSALSAMTNEHEGLIKQLPCQEPFIQLEAETHDKIYARVLKELVSQLI